MSAHPSEMSWVGTGTQSSLLDLAVNRLGTWMGDENYTTVNMNKARMYTPVPDVTIRMTRYSPYGNDLDTPLPDKIARGIRPSYSEMTSPETLARYTPAAIGDVFGPSWSTHWFRFAVSIPKHAFPRLHLSLGGGRNLRADPGRASGLAAAAEDADELHLIFDCECEGLIWIKGAPRQGFTGGNGFDRRAAFTLHPYDAAREIDGRLDFEFFIEIGCNGMFGNADGDNIRPPNPLRRYTLKTAEVRRLDAGYHRLFWHMQTLAGIAGELKEDTAGRQALRAVTQAANVVVPGDRTTYARGIEIMETFLASSGYKGSPLGHLHNNPAAARAVARRAGCEAAADAAGLLPYASETEITAAADQIGDAVPIPGAVQRVTVVGHCHIDTAWLWPYAETRRKVVRSWATQVELMKRYPHHKFALSTAQQMEWLRQDCPPLFVRVQAAVASGQFYPVGGTWVEQDANVPGSEGMVRQFLYGQRFFAEHFGMRSRLFWLPDTFGYCAQLPQILRGVGMDYFLTQKLSWNLINPFPYHTFLWKGIDGSSVLAHFPPTDTYTAAVSVGEVAKHQRQYRERAITTESILLFGNGDGGGGPQAEMIERIDRLDCAPGMPALSYGSPEALYDRLAAKAPELPRYDGELYLELHRGTYTTQAAIKLGNATLQQLLHDAEALGALAATIKRAKSRHQDSVWYPRDVLDRAWHSTLLNHFHDVLPGSCIKLIVDDALELYDEAAAAVVPFVGKAAVAVAEAAGSELVPRERKGDLSDSEVGVCFVNTLPFARTEVVELPEAFFASAAPEGIAAGDDDEKGLQYPESVLVPGEKQGYVVTFPRQGPTTGSFAGSKATSRLVRVTVPGLGAAPVAAPKHDDFTGVVVYRDRVTYPVPAPRCSGKGASKGRAPVSLIPPITTAAAVRGSSLRYRCAQSQLPCLRAHAAPLESSGVVLVSEEVFVLESESARYEVSSTSGRVVRAFDKRQAASAPTPGVDCGSVPPATVGSKQWQGADEWRLIFTPATDASVRAGSSVAQQIMYGSYAEAEAAAAAGAGTGAGHVAAAAAWAAEDKLPLAALGLPLAVVADQRASPATPRQTAARSVACELVSDETADQGASPATSWALTGSATPSPLTRAPAPAAVPASVDEASSNKARMRGPSAAEATMAALQRAPPRKANQQSSAIDEGDESYGGAALWVHTDVPLYWDGWDIELYHQQTRRLLTAAGGVRVLSEGGLKGVVEVVVPLNHPHAASPLAPARTRVSTLTGTADPPPAPATLRLRLSLAAGSAQLSLDLAADWRAASHEALKVEFPFHLRAPSAAFEIQYGWASRPAHTNTAVDLAKFEVCAQRWGAVSEATYTAAVLTRAKHGFSCRQGVMAVTLLRSPTRPDDECDRHVHRIALAVAPLCGAVAESGVTQAAQAFCAPLAAILAHVPSSKGASGRSFAGSGRRGVLVDTLKLAEPPLESMPHRASSNVGADSGNDVVLRVYDAEGAAGVGTVWVDARMYSEHPPRCVRCNLLEEADAGGEMKVDGPRPLTPQEAAVAYGGETEQEERLVYAVRLPLRAFEIATLRFTTDSACD